MWGMIFGKQEYPNLGCLGRFLPYQQEKGDGMPLFADEEFNISARVVAMTAFCHSRRPSSSNTKSKG